MSADILPTIIDLTDVPDTPPGGPSHTLADEPDEIVFMGVSRNPNRPQEPPLLPLPPHLPPPHPHYDHTPLRPLRGVRIPIAEDEDDQLDLDDRDPVINGMRIFSPPAQFTPPNRSRGLQPPPQHRPRIGLGGALFAIRNREPPARFHSQDAARRSGADAGPSRSPALTSRDRWGRAFNTFIQTMGLGQPDPLHDRFEVEIPAYRGVRANVEIPLMGGMVWDAGPNHGGVRGDAPWHISVNRRPVPAVPKSTYNHIMTHHRAVPRNGFSFDFDPSASSASAPIIIDDDDDLLVGSSSSSTSKAADSLNPSPPSLICARCDNPLVLGPRTAWALRCGHVICAACANEVSQPMEGKGKEKEVDPGSPDVQGKGTVKQDNVNDHPPAEAAPSHSIPKPRTSRRPRASFASASRQVRNTTRAATAKSLATPPPTKSPAKRKQSQTKGATGKAKGKPQSLVGTIGKEHVYECPVVDCHKEHKSVHIWEERLTDGLVVGDFVWRQKEGAGAIPIFT